MDWRGVGSRSITSTGGLSHQLVPGTRRLSKRGNKMLLATRTGRRLRTPVEIPTKKTFSQTLALPKTAPSAVHSPVLPNGDPFTSLPPLIRASVSNTLLYKPAAILHPVIVLVPWFPGLSLNTRPSAKPISRTTLQSSAGPASPIPQRCFLTHRPCSDRCRHIMFCCQPADAIPWHPHRRLGGGVLLTTAPRSSSSSNHKP